MAKNIAAVGVLEGFVISTHNKDQMLHVANLPQKSIEYLLQYGMSKSLQDSASGCIKVMTSLHEKINLGTATDAESKAFTNASQEIPAGVNWETGAEFAEAVAQARKDARLEKILQGLMDVGTTGPRLKGIDAVIRDVAIAALRKAYAKAKLTWPTETKVVNLQVQRYLEKNLDKARAEAERQMAADLGDDEDMDFIKAA